MSNADHIKNINTRVLVICVGVVFGMTALSFASVPLYRIFCQVTGFGGTTQIADAAPGAVLSREVTVRFDSNMAPGLAWDFAPSQVSQRLRIGEVGLAFFTAHNYGATASTGVATFNVTPFDAGPYFKKIQCFCFSEQTLEAGEEVLMPVYYYVDPAIADERRLDDITTITLSYTFFPTETPQASLDTASGQAPDRVVAGIAMEQELGQTGP